MTALDVQASEKVYASFSLTVKSSGGHSSLPIKDNAIYRLAAGLQRLAAFEFPIQLTDITRLYFERMAPLSGAAGPDMKAVAGKTFTPSVAARLASRSTLYNALLRTTCVATMLQAGHAENALPQTAQATVNCRLLPIDSAAKVQETLVKVLADPQIVVAPIGTATAQSALAAGARAAGRDRNRGQGCVGHAAADHPAHGDRRHGWTVPAQRRHSRLRRQRHLRSTPTTCVRTARTSASW